MTGNVSIPGGISRLRQWFYKQNQPKNPDKIIRFIHFLQFTIEIPYCIINAYGNIDSVHKLSNILRKQ